MPTLSTITLFAVAAIALLLIPGPVVLFIVARSIEQGRRAGLVSTLAAGLGDSVHVIGATLGLSAIIASSALAFNVVKYAGAAYLIFLGIRTLMSGTTLVENGVVVPQRLTRIFTQGVVVSALNPKTALFFLAFLPQFVQPNHGTASMQILFFGILFILLAMGTNSVYAVVASAAGRWLHNAPTFVSAQRYFAGSVYISLGLLTAITGTERNT